MAFTYNSNAKFQLSIRFEFDEDAEFWVNEADDEVLCGEQRKNADNWVDMWIDGENDLKHFIKLALKWDTVEYFSVQKH